MRKESTCYCSAYKYPHRFISGNCNGWTAVENIFEKDPKCRDCTYYFFEEDLPDEPRGEHYRLLEGRKSLSPGMCPELGQLVKEKK